jgi:hypothetical protein
MKLEDFFNRLISLGFMNENGNIFLKVKKVKNWPSNLDIENWEIDTVSPGEKEGFISGRAGGDWQDMARFTIMFPASKQPYCVMFDSPSCFKGENIYKNLKKIVKETLRPKFNHFNY